VLAVSMLVFQGAVARGSATWGAVAAHVGVSRALLWAGVGGILSVVLALFLRLSDATPMSNRGGRSWWQSNTDASGAVTERRDGEFAETSKTDTVTLKLSW
jgi:hypothetical protein